MDTLFSMKVFCQVVQSGSFTRAADLLDISIPMASKHVSHLEKHVGTQLLHRHNRHLRLTEQGETYFRECSHALELLEQAAEQASAGRYTPHGILRVNAPVWFACDVFAKIIAAYHAQYPDVEVVLTLSNRHVDLNIEGEDLALRLSYQLNENLIAKKISEIPFYLVASPSYLAAHGTPTTPQDLMQHQCVLPTYTNLATLEAEYQGNPITLNLQNSVARSNHTQMLAKMIRVGMGIGYMPAWLANDDLATGKLVRLLPELTIGKPPLYAVYANRQFMKAKVRTFIDFLADYFRAA